MLKTLKRKIALVAVAGLGFGLVSTVPANAAPVVAANIGFKLDDLGIAQNADQTIAAAATGAAADAVTRVGATLSVHTITKGAGDALPGKVRLRITTAGGAITLGSWVNTPADATTAATIVVPAGCGGTVTCSLAVDSSIDGTTLSATSTLVGPNAFTSTANHLLTVRNAGAPTSVSWTTPAITQLSGTAVDRVVTISPKDSSGVSTILLDSETIGVDISPVTGVATSQVGLSLTGAGTNAVVSYSVPETTTVTDGVYSLAINGNGSDAGVTGSTLPGTTYTLSAQLLNGTAAVGAPANLTYKRLSNTASMTGNVDFVDGTTVTTAVTSLSSAVNVAASGFKVKATDSNGGVLQGATVTLSVTGVTGAFTNNNQQTGTDGITATTMVFTPDASGSGTIVATITTGTGTITKSIPVTVAGYGATVAAVANATAINLDGTGWKAGTAPAYDGALNITKIQLTLTGLDANKAVKLSTTGTTVDNLVSDIGLNPIADATGKIVATLTFDGVNTGERVIILADADGAAGGTADVTVLNALLSTANTGVLSTSPLTGTTTFAAPSAKSNIVATVKNQFGSIVTGGVVVFVNSTKPAAATAQTTKTVTVGADGTATFGVELGSAVGTYVYTATAKDVNGVDVTGTATSTITYVVTASGAPKTITVTGGANTATTQFRVLIDGDGTIDTDDVAAAGEGPAAAKATTLTTNAIADAGAFTTMTVSVTDDAGAGVAGVLVTATPDAGVIINSAAAANVPFSSFNEAGDLAVATAAGGVATFYVSATKPGTLNVKFAAGSSSVTGSFRAVTNSQLDVPAAKATGRTISLDKTTASVSGNVVQVIATVKDIYGNAVAGVNLSGAITGTAGRFTGGGRTQAAVASDANGQVVFEVTSNGAEAGTGTLTVTAGEVTQAEESGAVAGNGALLISNDLSAASTTFGTASTKSATAALTVTAAAAAASPAIDAVKADVKAVSDTVATLSKAVTTIQSSVTELTTSFTAQIKSLSSAIAKISRAIAALSKKIK